MVFRNDPHRTVRRRAHGRRRFCVARWRGQFRQRAGTGRKRLARRNLQHRRSPERRTQDRSAAGAHRAGGRARSAARADLLACAQPRNDPGPLLRTRHRQSVADGERTVRQCSAVQSAKAVDRFHRRRRPDAGRRTGRRSLVRHLRTGVARQIGQGAIASGVSGGMRPQFLAGEGQAGDAVVAR